jgi:tetratricopeptide (TPR) repeat protein
LNVNHKDSGAIEDFDKALALRPNYFEAFKSRGIAYASKKEYDKSIESFESALAINNSDAETFYLKGNAQYFKGDNKQAIESYSRAIEKEPKFHEAYYNRGTVSYLLGDFNDSIADFRTSVSIKSDFPEAYNNLGVALYVGGLGSNHYFDEQVIGNFNKAISLNPSFAETYCNLGIVYYSSEDFVSARSNIDKALELDPNLKKAKYYKNLLLIKSGWSSLVDLSILDSSAIGRDSDHVLQNLLEAANIKKRYDNLSI